MAGVAQAPSEAMSRARRGRARMRVSRTAKAQPTKSVETTQSAAKRTVAVRTCQNCGSVKSRR